MEGQDGGGGKEGIGQAGGGGWYSPQSHKKGAQFKLTCSWGSCSTTPHLSPCREERGEWGDSG